MTTTDSINPASDWTITGGNTDALAFTSDNAAFTRRALADMAAATGSAPTDLPDLFLVGAGDQPARTVPADKPIGPGVPGPKPTDTTATAAEKIFNDLPKAARLEDKLAVLTEKLKNAGKAGGDIADAFSKAVGGGTVKMDKGMLVIDEVQRNGGLAGGIGPSYKIVFDPSRATAKVVKTDRAGGVTEYDSKTAEYKEVMGWYNKTLLDKK